MEQTEETIDLLEVLRAMFSKLWLILLLAIVGSGAAYAISQYLLPLKFASYTTMYVRNDKGGEDISISQGDLNVSQSLVSTYATVLRSSAVMSDVSEILISQYELSELSSSFQIAYDSVGTPYLTTNSLLDCITIGDVNGTEVMKITAVTQDPEISAAVCNALTQVAPSFLKRVVGAGSVETIDVAAANDAPVSPNVMKNTLIGGLAGVVLAAGIIFLLFLFDKTVKNPERLSERFQKAIIGEIEVYGSEKQTKRNVRKHVHTYHYLTVNAPTIPFQIVESYKTMRTNIMFALSTTGNKVFAISSPNPAEGKTITAANIAITLAQMEHKVLLIDADLRQSAQHKVFGVQNQGGLSSVIGQMSTVEKCIHKEVLPRLDLLTAGPNPPNPSELLASKQCAQLLEQLKEQYDYIVIDTPPINVVSDVTSLSRSMAGVFMVLRYGITTLDDVENATKLLALADVENLGFVLHGVKRPNGSSSSYYRSRYGKYGYGSHAKSAQEKPKLETNAKTPEAEKHSAK